MKKVSFIVLCLFVSLTIKSQDKKPKRKTSPKLVEFNFQSFNASNNAIHPTNLEERNNRMDLMYDVVLRFPVYLGKETKVFGEIKQNNEFVFGFHSKDDDGFQPLELLETSSSIVLLQNLKNNWRFTGILNMRINSNRFLYFNPNATRYSVATIIEKKEEDKSFGLGLIASFNHQRTILPIIKYKTRLGANWNVDIFVPSRALLSYSISNKSSYFFGVRGNAASYYITNDDQISQQYVNSFYRRISINTITGYESMFNKFLGYRAEVGITVPLRMEFSDFENNAIHNFQPRFTPYLSLGFFLALPR